MAQNPETIITNRVRKKLKQMGCHTIKISDQFTRGIPDMMVVGSRIVMVEFKMDRRKSNPVELSYRQLKLTGAQDHHIRQLSRRSPHCVCVVTDVDKGERLKLWVPYHPWKEGPEAEMYICVAEGDSVYTWLT